ncbi:MAG: MATE family efflux transporter [Oliverpabstia sp.]
MKVNLLKGSILKSLVLFAAPLLVSRIFQQLYNTVDTMIVGNYLGDTSLAAIGSCSAIYDLLVGFALGIGNGLAIVTARSYGAGKKDEIKKSVASSIVIGIICSIVVSVIGSFILYPLLKLLNTPAEIIGESYQYISLIVMSIIVMFAYNLCAGLLRAIGDSLVPLIFLMFSSLLNIGLDLLFIVRFQWGVTGAALATVLSEGISAILCLIYIGKKMKLLIPAREHFVVDRELYGEMLGQGFSMGFMSSIVSMGSVILQYGINGLGYLTIAAHTTARKLYLFFNMPFASLSLATSTFVSQNRGANQKERIRSAVRIIYICDIILAAIITVILLLFSRNLVQLISGSKESIVLDNGSLYLKVVGPFYAVLGVLGATRYALQGLGEKILPLISSIIELAGKIVFVLLFIPRFGYNAVIACEPVIWCIMAIQLVYSFYAHPYMKRRVKGKPVVE